MAHADRPLVRRQERRRRLPEGEPLEADAHHGRRVRAVHHEHRLQDRGAQRAHFPTRRRVREKVQRLRRPVQVPLPAPGYRPILKHVVVLQKEEMKKKNIVHMNMLRAKMTKDEESSQIKGKQPTVASPIKRVVS